MESARVEYVTGIIGLDTARLSAVLAEQARNVTRIIWPFLVFGIIFERLCIAPNDNIFGSDSIDFVGLISLIGDHKSNAVRRLKARNSSPWRRGDPLWQKKQWSSNWSIYWRLDTSRLCNLDCTRYPYPKDAARFKTKHKHDHPCRVFTCRVVVPDSIRAITEVDDIERSSKGVPTITLFNFDRRPSGIRIDR